MFSAFHIALLFDMVLKHTILLKQQAFEISLCTLLYHTTVPNTSAFSENRLFLPFGGKQDNPIFDKIIIKTIWVFKHTDL